MLASGNFNVALDPQKDEHAPVGRMCIDKDYFGEMLGKGIGQMISKRTESGTAVYSAIEEFEGTINGKSGTFTLFHLGKMSSTEQSLDILIVSGSGQKELTGIEGSLSIVQEGGTHKYTLEYTL